MNTVVSSGDAQRNWTSQRQLLLSLSYYCLTRECLGKMRVKEKRSTVAALSRLGLTVEPASPFPAGLTGLWASRGQVAALQQERHEGSQTTVATGEPGPAGVLSHSPSATGEKMASQGGYCSTCSVFKTARNGEKKDDIRSSHGFQM